MVRLQRLVIEGDRATIGLDLHPRLTVITGVGEVERQSLTSELIGALAASRSGIHLELVADDGSHLAVFRPRGGRHRIVDVGAATDVTDAMGAGEGADLLAAHGLSVADARRSMRVTPAELTTAARSDAIVCRLAEADQIALWSAAARVRVTDETLQAASAASGTAPEDADIINQIEQRHHRLESAVEGQVRLQRLARIVTALAVLAAAGLLLAAPPAAPVALAVGALHLVLAFVYRTRVAAAEQAERAALDAAGAESYLGFHLQRVEELVTSEQTRRRLLDAAKDHRAAASAWFDVAGDVSVEWALGHHDAIAVAARLRTDMRNLGAASNITTDDETAGELAHALLAHMTRVRALGRPRASFPLILDEPFTGLSAAVKGSLLELLAQRAGDPQVILLTEDEDVASWARLEALAGELSVLEPTAEETAPRALRPGVA